MTTTNTATQEIKYIKDRVNLLTENALQAESRYILALDNPKVSRLERDFTRWEYEFTLKELGQAINDYVDEMYRVKCLIDKRMRRAA